MRSKYNNKKTVVDGIKFDSIAESIRYCELKLLEKAGKITELKLQQKYEIVSKSKHGRALNYIADFTYLNEFGQLVVEDVKGVKTGIYKLKKRLVAEIHGIEIKEMQR